MFILDHVTYKSILNIEHLHIPKGKTTCILGESGCGKTTLLKLLNKFISPDQGMISFDGVPLNVQDTIPLRRKVVMLGQTPAIFPGTIEDNLQIGLEFSEQNPASSLELNVVLRSIQLDKSLTDDAERLSGGEKQRLALGRILLMQPDTILLDEPSSSLDRNTEDSLIRMLVDAMDTRDKSIVMVTHTREIAFRYADHIVEMSAGKVVKSGEVNQWTE
jgi:putative ABC transport system ATP-binding protein